MTMAQDNSEGLMGPVSAEARAAMKGQRPFVLWLTGLSGAGKSTLAEAIDQRLHGRGLHSYVLDGDIMRHGLNRDLGFSADDRRENIRRTGEVSRLLVDAGLIVVSAFISPYRADRELLRQLFPAGQYIEIYVEAPLAVCEQRDPTGLYKRARAGEIRDFTGIGSPYESPLQPDISLRTDLMSPVQCVEEVFAVLQRRGCLQRG